jgi:uncharacterized protein YndB with AHSA1/START domain
MALQRRTIRQTFEIRSSPDRVYTALTSPGILNRWFTDKSTMAAKPGGRYRFSWNGGYLHKGKVLAATPSRLLVLAWPQDGLETEVSFKISKSREGSLLRFQHEGVGFTPDRSQTFVGIYTGWMYYLSNLRALLETDRDLRSRRDRYW